MVELRVSNLQYILLTRCHHILPLKYFIIGLVSDALETMQQLKTVIYLLCFRYQLLQTIIQPEDLDF